MGENSGILTGRLSFASQPRTSTMVNANSVSAGRPGTRLEDDLLLCCARTQMKSTTAERLRELLCGQIDWIHLLATASRHGLLPLLYWQLQATCPELVPPTWMDDLRDYAHRIVRFNLFLTSELHKILEKFEADGVIAVPLKGPALAASVYGNLALREFIDLDFLLREQDVPGAHESLASLGYRPRFHPNNAEKVAQLRTAGQYPFARTDGRSLVELHSEMTLRHFPVPPDLRRLWKRLEPICLGGKKVLTLCPEDLLLILCVHGAKDFWEQLKWICDISELIRIHKGMDWEQVMEETSRLGCERMLFLGLYLASDILGAALPKDIWRRVQADPGVKSLAAEVSRQLFQEANISFSALQRCLFRMRMRDGLWDGIRYFLRLGTTPTEEDCALAPLPAPLFSIYYLLRPLRLMKNYGLGLLHRRVALDLAPFVPTPMGVVGRMLKLAEVGPTDVVYDLGCGDGRLIIEAAKRFGARGVGVDIDPRRISKAKANARKQRVDHLVKFIQQDAKTVNVAQATVVLLYLSWGANIKIRPMLFEQLRPGARIVSRDFNMGRWQPDKTEMVEDVSDASTILYLWRMEEQPPGPQTRPVFRRNYDQKPG